MIQTTLTEVTIPGTPSTSTPQQQKRKKKSKNQAIGDAFACQLFYFIIKVLVVYMIYKYKNPLKESFLNLGLYGLLLLLNSYLILTIGKDPGFAPKFQEQEGSETQTFGLPATTENVICEVCGAKKYLRTKHCYQCGVCIYKHDHHCPWIGACVGQYNHGVFWTFLLTQGIQALWTFVIMFQAMDNYSYKAGDNDYSKEYGAIVVVDIFMFFYVLFAVGLFIYHSFLIAVDLTSYQMTKGSKLLYMRAGYPFYTGIVDNFRKALFHDRSAPIKWKAREKDGAEGGPKKFNYFDNQYYSCC